MLPMSRLESKLQNHSIQLAMALLRSLVKQVKQVSQDSRALLQETRQEAASLFLEARRGAHPRPAVHKRYNPDKDDYDPRTAPVLPYDPFKDLRAKKRQLLALQSRVKRGGDDTTLAGYKAVAKEVQAEVEESPDLISIFLLLVPNVFLHFGTLFHGFHALCV
ncbi:unnamed protein product [Effrenium voratum]|nr:unnamed protein product [Effrenium voratum]